MTTTILRRRHRHASLLTLEPSDKVGIRELGLLAVDLVGQQDPLLWAQASDNDYLAKIAKGAIYLRQIGYQNGPSVLVKDNAAHHAMMTCYFIASRSDQLCSQARIDLRTTIQILAECCPFDLPLTDLPELSALPDGLRLQSIMRKHYPAMLTSRGSYELTLADALRLLFVMERAATTELASVVTALSAGTEGLRVACARVKD